MKSRLVPVLALLMVEALSWSFDVRAEVDDDMKRAMARELGAEGLAAIDRSDWSTALDRLNRAYQLHPVPTLALWTGHALEKLGRLVEAAERYREATQLGTSGGNEEQQRQAQRAADAAYTAVLPRIAKLTIEVQGELPTGTEVTLDGRALPRVALQAKIPIDPGTHVVALSGSVPNSRKVNVAEAADVKVQLEAEPAAGESSLSVDANASRRETATDASRDSARKSAPYKTWGYIALGVGAAGLGTFGVTGALTLHKRSQLDKWCTGSVCDPSYQGELDSFRNYRTISSIAFIVGTVGAATGTVLLVTAPHQSHQRRAGLRLIPRIGLGEIGLEGSY